MMTVSVTCDCVTYMTQVVEENVVIERHALDDVLTVYVIFPDPPEWFSSLDDGAFVEVELDGEISRTLRMRFNHGKQWDIIDNRIVDLYSVFGFITEEAHERND